MKQVIIDFTNCKSLLDLHTELAQKLDFPDFYGQNLDALWDCLTGFIEVPVNVSFKSINTLPKDLQQYALQVFEVFVDAEKKYNEVHPLLCEA